MKSKVEIDRSLFRDLFLDPILVQRRRLFAIAAALFTLAAAQGVFLLTVGRFFKALFQDKYRAEIPLAELLPSEVLQWFPRLAGEVVDGSVLTFGVPCLLFASGLIWAFCTYVFQINQQLLTLEVARNYRERLFEALMGRPFLEIRQRSVGEWMSVIMNDVMFLQMRMSDIMIGLVRDSVIVTAGFLMLLYIHWPTAILLVAAAPFAALVMGRTAKRIARYSELFQRELSKIAARVLDLRGRFEFIRAQGAEALESARFDEVNRRYFQMIRKSIFVRSVFGPSIEAIGFIAFAGCVYAIGQGAWSAFTPALLLQFLAALGVMLKPLRELGEQITRLQETRGVLRESLEVFVRLKFSGQRTTEASAVESPVDHVQIPGSYPVRIDLLRAGFGKEVRFSTENLQLIPGQCIAVVGPSGAGKSTLIKCLAGLIEPVQWQASTPMNGGKALEWASLCGFTSLVSQDPFLFDDSLRNNLIYGLPHNQWPPSDALWSALEVVNMAGEIKGHPDGLDVRIRAIGSNISGGQLQRLVIARSLLRRKPILLLDEATSAIDTRSERDITERLCLMCKRDRLSLLAVTHRLQWLNLYDEVWFVEGGEIRLKGRHKELLSDRRYADYCDSQEV